jgi:hypothetical protein
MPLPQEQQKIKPNAQVTKSKLRVFSKIFNLFPNKDLQTLTPFKSHDFSTEMRKFAQVWEACFSPPLKKSRFIP